VSDALVALVVACGVALWLGDRPRRRRRRHVLVVEERGGEIVRIRRRRTLATGPFTAAPLALVLVVAGIAYLGYQVLHWMQGPLG
jgi:hypothetical protein